MTRHAAKSFQAIRFPGALFIMLVLIAVGIVVADRYFASAKPPATTAASQTQPASTSAPTTRIAAPATPTRSSTTALPTGPINARIGGGPINGQVPGTGTPNSATPNPSGQALNTEAPQGDHVEVFKDNQWLPATVLKREGNRLYIQYYGRGDASNEWVGPDRVRAK